MNKENKEWVSNLSVGFGVASIFLWSFSIFPLIAVATGVFSLVYGWEGRKKAIIGLTLGVIFLLVAFYNASPTTLSMATTQAPIMVLGLDMWLNKRRYVKNWDHMAPEELHEVTLKREGKEIKLDNPKYIIEEAGCWRKANAIHGWFVKNIQRGVDDCKEYDVCRTDLENLLGLVQKVLKSPGQASKLLPTQEGFFFGSYDYDKYYFEDLKYTEDILTKALSDTEAHDFTYQSSW